jgi:Leucine-rich repeat (LRR) protein
MLTAAMVKKEAGEYDVEVVQRLRVSRAALAGIGQSLQRCSLLLDLALPHNRLGRLEGLGGLIALTSLDLSFNRIKLVGGGLEGLKALRSLDLRANAIEVSLTL